jgi:acyl-[acyl-carrier-protein]-phospholipid O-acyltransferase/long-chain-fatty-acid--[acyl-carrier-protein] ligase
MNTSIYPANVVKVEGNGGVIVGSPMNMPPMPAGWTSLASAFVHKVRQNPQKEAIADSSGVTLTYQETFLRALALSRALSRQLGKSPYVGLLLPPMVPSAVVNIAVTLLGRVPVNLNYSGNSDSVNSSIRQTGIEYVVGSRKLLEHTKLSIDAKFIDIEDLAKQVTPFDRVWALAVSKLPFSALSLFVSGVRAKHTDTAVVMFTSGTTAEPKGVVHSHRNILSNIWQVIALYKLSEDEVVLGVLPLFHALAFNLTLWNSLLAGRKVVYHGNARETKRVGKLIAEHQITAVVCVATLMRAYLKSCPKEQFGSVCFVMLGGEKVQNELARLIEEVIGVIPLEGFGSTETAPFLTGNVLGSIELFGRVVDGNRLGSVGQLAPETWAKVTDPDTGEILPLGAVGLLHFKGPQVMDGGYLNRVAETEAALQDGWYNTGDIGRIDEDLFFWILDRQSRFAKIGAEMVPLATIEEKIREVTQVDESCVSVTIVNDQVKGERIFVVYTSLGDREPAEVIALLKQTELDNRAVPKAADFVRVDSFPVTQSGKLDHGKIKQIARQAIGNN